MTIILSAQRTFARAVPKVFHPVARQGLNYEKHFIRALTAQLPPSASVEHNPWFAYRDSRGESRYCCPDALLLNPEDEFATVFELKRTWLPDAGNKLRDLYCPVVARALGLPAVGIVVCRGLTPDAPRPAPSLSFALLGRPGLYHWIGTGPIQL